MSGAVRQTILILEGEVEAIEQRRGELLRAIESLRPLADEDTSPRRRSKQAVRRNERTNERAKRGPARRSLPDGTTQKTARHHEAIVTALRAKRPQSPSELAKALKIALPTLRYQITPLVKSGAVLATGTTNDRQFSLPGRTAAKEAP